MFCRKLFAGAVAALAVIPALAQDFPSHPLRIIVVQAAGATNDTIARMYAAKLTDQVKQAVLVENRAGGNGIPGADYVAKSAPDGYTLLFGQTTVLAIQGSLFPKLPYDPKRDFTPVSVIAISPSVLVVNTSVPARNIKELIAYAKANPGKLNFGSAGSGSPFHLSGEVFKSQTGTDIVHVPYKGNAPAIVDLLSGQLQMLFANPPDILGHLKAGKLRAIVSTGPTRIPLLPDVPTVAEEGLKNAESVSFFAIAAPRGTPRDIVHKLYAELARAGRSPDIRARLTELGADPVDRNPEESAVFIQAQIEKWAKVIKESGAKPDE